MRLILYSCKFKIIHKFFLFIVNVIAHVCFYFWNLTYVKVTYMHSKS